MGPSKKAIKPSVGKYDHLKSCAPTPRKSEKWRDAINQEKHTKEPINDALGAMEAAIISGKTDDARQYIYQKLSDRLRTLAVLGRFNPDVCDNPDYWNEGEGTGTQKVDPAVLTPDLTNTPLGNGGGQISLRVPVTVPSQQGMRS